MSDKHNKEEQSFANIENIEFLEEIYSKYKDDPSSVSEGWNSFFKGFELGNEASAPLSDADESSQLQVLIQRYRRLGHLCAKTDPLSESVDALPDLALESVGLEKVDGDKVFRPGDMPIERSTLKEILSALKETYCSSIGADFYDIDDNEAVQWFEKKMEPTRNSPEIDLDLKKNVLNSLLKAEGFEKFLHSRYLGQKRFSLEGLDSLIPLLHVLADEAAKDGVKEMDLGMPHRGRLNVLANFLRKPMEKIISEFEGADFNPFDIDGDVKYHLGYVGDITTFSDKKLRLHLSNNPSHLEVVGPVVEGYAAARQSIRGDNGKSEIVPLIIHGDAAFAGQGVVSETLNLSRIDGYSTGGTIHIVVNNQIGFTANPNESRSTSYSTDIAKIVRAPVLHVNADDVEAVVWSAMVALQYRQKFGRDIVIDLIGYRRHGHNEIDEPAFTQPKMYRKIAAHPTVLKQYSEKLVSEGVVERGAFDKSKIEYTKSLDEIRKASKSRKRSIGEGVEAGLISDHDVPYRKVSREELEERIETGVDEESLVDIGKRLAEVPEGFQPHPKISKLLENRRDMSEGKTQVDWAMAELLAFGTLGIEGQSIRLSGQDSQRGTFTSRHAVLHDYETGAKYEPLKTIGHNGVRHDVLNSPLSEVSVLGFEFGYSIADRDTLTMWEAQFGDFANGAQVVIDQFIVSSEAKWKQLSGLVMLLPHGHEGQGPEHSSARLERFLQVCDHYNIQVANPTTPAQYFHLLRRQMKREFRKPLVVMTPKSLLRLPECVSERSKFLKGTSFEEVLIDDAPEPSKVKRVVFSSGKIFYDLLVTREANDELKNVPLVRLEQLYPFPYQALKKITDKYPDAELIWAQEEPGNMGAWSFVKPRFKLLSKHKRNLKYVGRKHSGTPAEGARKAHLLEQQRITNQALGAACSWKPDRPKMAKQWK